MFLDYLRDREDEIREAIFLKKKELEQASFELKENQRFIELLESEKATPFTEFTPQVVSATEKQMHEDLLLQGNDLMMKKDYFEKELRELERELSDVLDAIKDARDAVRNERMIRKEDNKIIKDRIRHILKEGEYNPAKGMSSLRKFYQELQ